MREPNTEKYIVVTRRSRNVWLVIKSADSLLAHYRVLRVEKVPKVTVDNIS